MGTAADRITDTVLDAIDAVEFERILQQVDAPADAFLRIGLIDVGSDRASAIPDDEGGLAAVAADLFGAGGGAAFAGLMGAEEQAVILMLRIGGQAVVVVRGERIAVVEVAAGSRADLPRLGRLTGLARAHLEQGRAEAILSEGNAVCGVWLFDRGNGRLADTVAPPELAPKSVLTRQSYLQDLGTYLAGLVGDLPAQEAPAWLQGALIADDHIVREWLRVPFVPRLVCAVESQVEGAPYRIWGTADEVANDVLRDITARVLAAGLDTMIEPFPETDVEFDAIIAELRALPADDFEGRLVLGGFADRPVSGPDSSMRCQECIYFLPKRRWCDLPELPLPVEPDWFCRMWKL